MTEAFKARLASGTRGLFAAYLRATPAPERVLDALNILLSDVRYGLGAYLGVYLVGVHHWDEADVGLALSLGGLSGLIFQTPLGALVDATRKKRLLLGAAILIATLTTLFIPLAPRFWPVALAGIVGALGGAAIGPAMAAISLGIVGPERFALRAGRNEALFHAGNAVCNVFVLLTAASIGPPVVFWIIAVTAALSVGALALLPARSIDHDLARGLHKDAAAHGEQPSRWRALLESRPLLIFAATGALFHLGNAAMLGLVAEKLTHLYPGEGVRLTAACAIAAQTVMVPTAALAGAAAGRIGRKPLFVLAYVALALRGLLFAFSDDAAVLIGAQALDGIGAGLIGALFPVIVADLTQGGGHFNAAQGGVGTVHGIGGMISAALGGALVVKAGYPAAFAMLAGVAVLGGALFWRFMPETKPP